MDDEAIFGYVEVRELQHGVQFTPTYARLQHIVSATYSEMRGEIGLNKKLTLEMLLYHTFCTLWARLIDVKAKQGRVVLTETERNYRRCFKEKDVHVLQPMYAFLRAIGSIQDKRGKRLYLVDHMLPVSVFQNKTGYHTPGVIDENNHNIYEEVPTLGIIGDVLMAMTSNQPNPVPNITVIPQGLSPSDQLLGYTGLIGPRREEIKQILESVGITPEVFPESVIGTRFNAVLFNTIDTIISETVTFQIKTLNITNTTSEGSEVELVITTPRDANNARMRGWCEADVHPQTVSADSLAIVGASYFAGFQLQKEAFENSHMNWCCLRSADPAWVPPNAWIQNRNERRALPPNYAEPQYVGMIKDQSYWTLEILRRMRITEQ